MVGYDLDKLIRAVPFFKLLGDGVHEKKIVTKNVVGRGFLKHDIEKKTVESCR